MNAIRPGAESEYSRGDQGFSGPSGGARAPLQGLSGGAALALLVGGLAGAILLLAAEFTPLLTVRTSVRGSGVTSVSTGSHDSWALVPLAVLAALMSLGAWRARSRLALAVLGVVGLVAAVIALVGDLPDAQQTGLIGSAATHFAIAASSPAAGFYLETLGAAVLIITAGVGLLLSAPGRPARVAGSAPAGPVPD
ncbi:MAG TPA: hypothetical protein VFN55_14735 [Solirubrobacteraceae bacterium]|nr:hypothetical protein [Solirubrobacteraceae bacterium]